MHENAEYCQLIRALHIRSAVSHEYIQPSEHPFFSIGQSRRTSRVDRTGGWNRDTFGYSSCRKCGCLAATETTEVLLSATTASEGTERVTHWCEHCKYQWSQIVTTPKLEKTEDSGGGFSGGGFSGGSSSGSGGGGASW